MRPKKACRIKSTFQLGRILLSTNKMDAAVAQTWDHLVVARAPMVPTCWHHHHRMVRI